MDIQLLVKLTSRTWSLKILSLMDEGIPGRLSALLAETKASRPSFTASMHHLIDMELLERNPGHGHPLRPEFKLTDRGKIIAGMARRVVTLTKDDTARSIIRKSWTVPILAVTETPSRFSQIRSLLPVVTDRALSQSLGLLEDQEWIRRDINVSERLPFPTYKAINAGRKINRILQAHL